MWGPISAPDNMDQLLPSDAPELELGDWVYYENVGSYSIAFWSPFNGFPEPRIYYYIREDMR